jgi:hypothetical protein
VRLFNSPEEKARADQEVGVVGIWQMAGYLKQYIEGIDTNDSRVCYFCAVDLASGTHDVERALELCQFEVPDLLMLRGVWPGPARDCLSSLVSLQFNLSIDDSGISRELVVRNRKFIVGHSRLLVQLNRATDWNNDNDVEEFIQLATKERIYACNDLGCDLNLCHAELGPDEGMEMLVSCSHISRGAVRLCLIIALH